MNGTNLRLKLDDLENLTNKSIENLDGPQPMVQSEVEVERAMTDLLE